MKSTGYRKITAHRPPVSAGFTLIELMVGVTVGLMVVMTAIYTIVTARKASGTVTDVAAMKQQASYVMYVLGSQIRQTGSMDAVQESAATAPPGMPPMFYFPQDFLGFGTTTINPAALTGAEGGGSSDSLGVAIRSSPVLVNSQTDCLGNAFPLNHDILMTFSISANNELVCNVVYANPAIASPPPAALAQNVTDFQVMYRYRQGNATIIADANSLNNLGLPGIAGNVWDSVNAVEICIEMQGTELVPVIAGVTYINCQGVQSPQGNRLTRVYRSLYNLKVSV